MSRPRSLHFSTNPSHYSSIKAGLQRQRAGSGRPWWLQQRTLQRQSPAAGRSRSQRGLDGHNAHNCSEGNSALAPQPTDSQSFTPSPSYHAHSPTSFIAPPTPPSPISKVVINCACLLSGSSLRVLLVLSAMVAWSLHQRSRPHRYPCATVLSGLL